jgi:hypothetical protein
MGKIDKVKEQIGLLKVVFGLLIAITVSLIGWMAVNYKVAEEGLLIASTVLVIVLVYGVIVVSLKMVSKINELEDL